MRGWMVAVLMLATPAAAGQAQQFDLVCTAKKVVVRYRVDLERGEWCSDDCQRTQKINTATSTELVLAKKDAAYKADDEYLNRVNRVTGEWYDYSMIPGLDILPTFRKGRCEPAAFTGFPSAKF